MFTPLTNELSKIVTLFTPKITFHTLRYIIRSDIIRYSKTKLSSTPPTPFLSRLYAPLSSPLINRRRGILQPLIKPSQKATSSALARKEQHNPLARAGGLWSRDTYAYVRVRRAI